ncbi:MULTISPECIES: S49 family peptidase [unclassified Afipia]|uniref:S49 family peptidase n=1 Tax=unclassified Afipia TaxID=2642050 RepID=UPI0004129C18|nr:MULTISPECIES: S49 family peptidase [unclassified Afipia]
MFEHLAIGKGSDFDTLRRGLRKLHGEVVAFDGRESPELLSIVMHLARGNAIPDARLAALSSDSQQPLASHRTNIVPAAHGKGKVAAIVSVRGTATYDLEMWPYMFSTQKLARTVTELASDPSVNAIVLDVNTPGGAVTGTKEAADAIYAARSRKGIVAIVNPLCASAGYWLASQCSEIVAIPSADIGSVGVFYLHIDQSQMLADMGLKPTFISAGPFKTEANPLEPLSAAAKQFLQTDVDNIYADFVGAVARGRNTTASVVRSQFGGGRCLSSRDALAANMIDRIETADRALNQILNGSSSPRQATIARLTRDPADLTDEQRKRQARARRLRLEELSLR